MKIFWTELISVMFIETEYNLLGNGNVEKGEEGENWQI